MHKTSERRASSSVAYHLAMAESASAGRYSQALRVLGGEVRWLLDPGDPLRSYNRRLAQAFARRRLHGESVEQGKTLRLFPIEGHSVKAQARFVQRLMRRYDTIREVVEIGFNAGHSSYLFLSARPDVRVLSFDLGDHDYIDMAKALIDRLFPGRHELIQGDSTTTVPEFADAHPEKTFDLIYIDGGHEYEVARADIEHCARLSTSDSLLLMDDLEPDHEWGAGPARAWREAQAEGLIDEQLLVEDGFPLAGLTLDDVRSDGVVWGLGHYLTRGAATG